MLLEYLIAFLGAFLATLLWTPLVIRLGHRYQVLDRPGLRKIHKTPIPRLGGLAITLPILAVAAICFGLNREIAPLMGLAFFLFLVGLVDDLKGLRAKTKLLAQILAALAICSLGYKIETIPLGSLGTLHLGWLCWPLSILWIVGMTNAINLIDGLDGLAAGISAITMAVVASVAIHTGHAEMALLMLICLASLLAFLVFNFNPARIFLGDGGTYFLGFLLGAASVVHHTKSHALVGLTLPLLALGIPLFDTLFAIVRRSLERRPLFAPDGSHIHHRLVSLGITHRKTVILLYTVTLLIATFGMFTLWARGIAAILIPACLAFLLCGFFRMCGAVRLRESIQAIKQRLHLARQIQRERIVLQETDLRLREAETLDEWWESLCEAAERLDFSDLSVEITNGTSSPEWLRWTQSRNGAPQHSGTEFVIPTQERRSGHPVRINAHLNADNTVEAAGRKVALFSRLVEADSKRAEARTSTNGQ